MILELTKDLGKQVAKQADDDEDGRGEAMPLNCPVCRKEEEDFIQPLSSMPDREEILFCPKCKVGFKITLQE